MRGDLGCLFKVAKDAGYRVESIAASLNLCPSKLRRVFRSDYGVPIKRWLVEVRSVEVRMRLRGCESIAEIAYSVGFSHPKELSREFRKVYGLTPSAYRKRENARCQMPDARCQMPASAIKNSEIVAGASRASLPLRDPALFTENKIESKRNPARKPY